MRKPYLDEGVGSEKFQRLAAELKLPVSATLTPNGKALRETDD